MQPVGKLVDPAGDGRQRVLGLLSGYLRKLRQLRPDAQTGEVGWLALCSSDFRSLG